MRDATKTLQNAGGLGLINNLLKSVFQSHSAFDRFGIALLHAPFDAESSTGQVEPDPNLPTDPYVHFGNSALPVHFSKLASDAQTSIVPTCWGFGGPGTILPVEYTFSSDPASDQLTSSDLALFADIQSALAKSSISGIIGVSLLTHAIPGISFKSDAVITTLPFQAVSLMPANERYDDLWVFKNGDDATVNHVASGGRFETSIQPDGCIIVYW